MEDFKPLLDLLGGDQGRLAQLIVWMGALRVPMKLISGAIQSACERAIARVVATADTDDDHILESIIKSKFYRAAAFLLDWALSIKLPLELGPNAGPNAGQKP